MSVDGAKIYFVLPVLGGIPVTQTMLSSFLVMLLLCIAGYRLGRNLKKRPGSVQVLTEKAVSSLYNLVSDTMGAHNAHWTPLHWGLVSLVSVWFPHWYDWVPPVHHRGSEHHIDLGAHDQRPSSGITASRIVVF